MASWEWNVFNGLEVEASANNKVYTRKNIDKCAQWAIELKKGRKKQTNTLTYIQTESKVAYDHWDVTLYIENVLIHKHAVYFGRKSSVKEKMNK